MSNTPPNSLASFNPRLTKEWLQQKNGKLSPETVSIHSRHRVWWRCEKGHEFQASINNRHHKDSKCPYCMNRKIGTDNNLAVLSPPLAAQWHDEKNYPLTPFKVGINYSKKVWWRCEKGHEWEQTPASRNNQKSSCPYCSGSKASKENNLAIHHPHLIEEWDAEKNNRLTPFDVLPTTRTKVWWKCLQGHSYKMDVCSRTKAKSCPYCSGKRIGADNNLAILRPELLKIWDFEKNGHISPYEIAPQSNRVDIHWKCAKGHRWTGSPNQTSGCSYCLSRKVSEDNNLQKMNPEIAEEWHRTRNGNTLPDDVVAGSGKPAWWKCRKCGHEWKARIGNRTRKGTGCPECAKSAGTSFAEQSLYFYLKQAFPSTINRHQILIDNKKWEVDIYIPEIRLAIEYDGYYYHKSKKKQKHDQLKNEILEGSVSLLRIREQGLDPINSHGTTCYVRRNNEKETLKEAFEFISLYIRKKHPHANPHNLSGLSHIKFDIKADLTTILQMMHLQEVQHSIGNLYPHIIPYWDNEKNGSLSPYLFRETNETPVSWKCENGHEWRESIAKVVSRKHVCHTCQSVGFLYPEKMKKWDNSRNVKYDKYSISAGSRIPIWWVCENGHSYQRKVLNEMRSENCPYCANLKVSPDNCLHTTHPEIAKQWHPSKNGDFTPFNTQIGSSKKAWWTCEKGHEWSTSIFARVKNGKVTRCPFCINQKVCEDNSLYAAVQAGDVSESLLAEWDSVRNSDTPHTVVSGSGKKIWWTCSENHSWQARVVDRVQGKCKCPVCTTDSEGK